jgi:hypothetical protein
MNNTTPSAVREIAVGLRVNGRARVEHLDTRVTLLDALRAGRPLAATLLRAVKLP